jgi:hypothetical protein
MLQAAAEVLESEADARSLPEHQGRDMRWRPAAGCPNDNLTRPPLRLTHQVAEAAKSRFGTQKDPDGIACMGGNESERGVAPAEGVQRRLVNDAEVVAIRRLCRNPAYSIR